MKSISLGPTTNGLRSSILELLVAKKERPLYDYHDETGVILIKVQVQWSGAIITTRNKDCTCISCVLYCID